jgi:hypothetical protein
MPTFQHTPQAQSSRCPCPVAVQRHRLSRNSQPFTNSQFPVLIIVQWGRSIPKCNSAVFPISYSTPAAFTSVLICWTDRCDLDLHKGQFRISNSLHHLQARCTSLRHHTAGQIATVRWAEIVWLAICLVGWLSDWLSVWLTVWLAVCLAHLRSTDFPVLLHYIQTDASNIWLTQKVPPMPYDTLQHRLHTDTQFYNLRIISST